MFAIWLGPLMWLLATFTFLSAGSTMLRWATDVAVHQGHCTRHKASNIMIVWEYAEILFVGLAAGLGYWHLLGEEMDISKRHHMTAAAKFWGEEALLDIQWEPGEEVPVTLMLLTLVLMYLYKIFLVLVRDVISREGHELEKEFSHVRDAQCRDKDDYDAIWRYIRKLDESRKTQEALRKPEDYKEEGKTQEEQIDELIHELKLVGRYDKKVAFMLKRGMHPYIVRDGVNPFKIACGVVAFEFWWITDLMGRKMVYEAALLYILSSLLMLAVVFGPSTVRRCAPQADDRYIWAVNMFLYYGVAFAVLSNYHWFFTNEAVENLNMSGSTSTLQAWTIVAMLLTDAFFYVGIYGKLMQCQMDTWHKCADRMGLHEFCHRWDLWNCGALDSDEDADEAS